MLGPIKPEQPILHLPYLDGIRATLALYVLFHHIVIELPFNKINSEIINFIVYFFSNGRYAVDMFIVLSGYCLTIPIALKNEVSIRDYWSFIKKRSIRILPAYYIALALSLSLTYTLIGNKTGSHWDASVPVTSFDIFTHVLLIQDLFYETPYKINHTLWTISVEYRIYFLFPLIVFLIHSRGILFSIITCGITSLFLYYALPKIGLNFYSASPQYISLFLWGVIMSFASFSNNRLFLHIIEFKNFIPYATVMTGLLLIILVFLPFPLNTFTKDIIIGEIFGYTLFQISLVNGKLKSVFSWQPLVYIGSFGYSLYLIHAPFIELFTRYIVLPLNLKLPQTFFILLIPGSTSVIILSYVFYLIAEKPFLKQSAKKSLIVA